VDLLAHLEAFAAVAERRSFSAAAEQLHIAQPLLSRRIKNLERRLGGELFERSQRHVRITDLGHLLLPHAEDVIARTGHLLALAESAHRTAPIAVGIPPECEPAALARLISGAAAHGVPITVHESPARDRAAALEAGRLTCAFVRVPVHDAALVVPIGVASAARADAGATAAAGAVHLDSLRPRRAAAAAPPLRLLVLPEDDIALLTDRLARALAAAGIAERCMEVAASPSTAVAEVLGGSARLMCDERFAVRHGLAWSPLADRGLHRGYELSVHVKRPYGPPLGSLRGWLAPLLGAATGAVEPATPESPQQAEGEDGRRLAAGV
jgi:DNA-binding transcriptional LysR family regulator